MDRRRFVALLGSYAVAGCVTKSADGIGKPTETTATGTRTTTPATAATEPPEPTESPTTDVFTTTPYSASLTVFAATDDLTVRMRLSAWEGETVFSDETYDLDSGDTVSFDRHIEPSGDYRLTMWMDGNAVFERPVFDYEEVEVTIRSAERVEVTGLVEY